MIKTLDNNGWEMPKHGIGGDQAVGFIADAVPRTESGIRKNKTGPETRTGLGAESIETKNAVSESYSSTIKT